ncbi:MAG: glycosyltransferase family 2 protein [Sphingomonadales bacterium]|nr:glycosyltransferase family 2 protein [Sphingomonadales bacterium]
MRVGGFTFVRNALRYDYPVCESIASLLPLVDTLVVLLGNSEDGTSDMLSKHFAHEPRICWVDSVWDDTLREGGRVLAIETDKAYHALGTEFDWVIYLQADEVLHQSDYHLLRNAMEHHLRNPLVEGLLLQYKHFYGSYDYVGTNRRWYRREIRIMRPLPGLHAWRDAQGFRCDGRKLQVKATTARVFHYGWVKNPLRQQDKQVNFNRLWHSEDYVQEHIAVRETYDYEGNEQLDTFTGSHPAVMEGRISRQDWTFLYRPRTVKPTRHEKLLGLWEQITGRRLFEYRNYTEL